MTPPSRESSRACLPDLSEAPSPGPAARLDWVGMEAISMPVLLPGDAHGAVRVPARVAAHVDLAAPDERGIHMSRLYLAADTLLPAEPLTPCLLRRLLNDFLDSHQGLSTRARVRVDFELPVRRPALASGHSGWRSYPVRIAATLHEGELAIELALELTYSSTCPASAALSRAEIAETFSQQFGRSGAVEAAIVAQWLASEPALAATPHAQRSTATLHVCLAPAFADLPVLDLIDAGEQVLGTPVQTAVKRADEQAFARANARNLMFCEDAARRLQGMLEADPRIAGYRVRVAHHESLHAHDAVAIVAGGESVPAS
ncbi:MAG TPA: GTP cyclohydrolase FolE2 [Xanthomonadaceae bacterium]|nr:GTP cyclohydrolase FolE2 [Xanthomonadaceae bacterium]